ncbi:hypothetical protein L7F22_035128 [Adiantum nelumboides]|nr:hypothetical protein [Adiantum nelumboides]
MDPAKIDTICNWPDLKNVHEVRRFLGLCSYFRRYVRKFAEIASPLHMLTQKGVPFSWGTTEVTAFQTLKDEMTTGPVLILPDLQNSFEVYCDACGRSLGAVLMQEGRVIAYESRMFSKPEMIAQIYEKEFLAVIHALTQWRHYLLGTDFRVFTDHQILRYFLSQEQFLETQMRWMNILSQFHFQIVHVQGQKNVVADALSWKPLVQAISTIHQSSFEDMEHQYATDTDFAHIFTRMRDGETVAGYSIWEGYLMRKTMLSSDHMACQRRLSSTKILDLRVCFGRQFGRTLARGCSSRHRSTRRLTGNLRLPIQWFWIYYDAMKVPPFRSTKDKIFEADEYTRDLDTAFAKVRETLQKSQEGQKKAADRHRRDLKLKENDWVLLRFEKARLRKKKAKERLFPKLSDVPDDGEPDEQPEVEDNEEILVPEQIVAHKDMKKGVIKGDYNIFKRGLKKEGRRNEFEMKKLHTLNQRQKMVLQRKTEEAAAVTRRLKELLEVRKHVARESSCQGSAPSDDKLQMNEKELQQWLNHELEVAVRINEVRTAYEKQTDARTSIAKELEELRKEEDSNQGDQSQEETSFANLAVKEYHTSSTSVMARKHRICFLDSLLTASSSALIEMAAELSDAEERERALTEHTRWSCFQSLGEVKCLLQLTFNAAAVARCQVHELELENSELRSKVNAFRELLKQSKRDVYSKHNGSKEQAVAMALLTSNKGCTENDKCGIEELSIELTRFQARASSRLDCMNDCCYSKSSRVSAFPENLNKVVSTGQMSCMKQNSNKGRIWKWKWNQQWWMLHLRWWQKPWQISDSMKQADKSPARIRSSRVDMGNLL